MLVTLLVVIVLLAIVVFIFLQQAKFGAAPQGERLEQLKKSPNYKEGKFHNLSPTPDLTEGVTYYALLKEFFFRKKGKTEA